MPTHQESGKVPKVCSICDITGFVCSVNGFEISSAGFVNTRNKSTLAKLHTFIGKYMKKVSIFKQSQLSSREDPEFAIPPFLIPHINIPTDPTLMHPVSPEEEERE